MNGFGRALAEACWANFDRMRKHQLVGHNYNDLVGVRQFVQRISSEYPKFHQGEPIRREVFRAIADELASERAIRSSGEFYATIVKRQRLAVEEGEEVRASQQTEDDLLNPALHPGEELFDPALSTNRLLARLGNNHLLVHPECLVLLPTFAGRGHSSTLPATLDGTITFARTINQVRRDYVVAELKSVGLIEESTEDPSLVLIASRIKPVALAFHAVEAFLEISEGRVNLSMPTGDVRRQLSFRVGPTARRLEEARWQASLRSDGLFRLEQGGARIRLEGEQLVWLAHRALVDPRWVGKVLQAAGEWEALAELRGQLRGYWEQAQKRPVDLDAFLSCFSRPE